MELCFVCGVELYWPLCSYPIEVMRQLFCGILRLNGEIISIFELLFVVPVSFLLRTPEATSSKNTWSVRPEFGLQGHDQYPLPCRRGQFCQVGFRFEWG